MTERGSPENGGGVETPSIYGHLTAEDNLKEQYRILGKPSFDGIPELLELVGLSGTGKKKAKHFSLGMKQRLGLAISLAGNPDFWCWTNPLTDWIHRGSLRSGS